MIRHAILAALVCYALIAVASIGVAWAQSAPSAGGFGGVPFTTLGQHMIGGGNPPAMSAGCGTGATVIGSDTWGNVLLGSATSQPCTLTFFQPFKQSPTCVVTAENFTPSYSRTAVALILTSLVDGSRVSWTCIARAGG